jgi:hypothetical protein
VRYRVETASPRRHDRARRTITKTTRQLDHRSITGRRKCINKCQLVAFHFGGDLLYKRMRRSLLEPPHKVKHGHSLTQQSAHTAGFSIPVSSRLKRRRLNDAAELNTSNVFATTRGRCIRQELQQTVFAVSVPTMETVSIAVTDSCWAEALSVNMFGLPMFGLPIHQFLAERQTEHVYAA